MGNVGTRHIWANRGLVLRVLGLQLSDLDKILDKHTLGDEERFCLSPMFVIIMGAEICLWTGLGFLMHMRVDGV